MEITINRNVDLTEAQAKASYSYTGQQQNGKPVFEVPTRKILKTKSAFQHKRLCDGSTFSLGMACTFRCSFCYVESQLSRNSSCLRIRKETGLSFQDVVIRRTGFLDALRHELVNRKGNPRFPASDHRVVFASPLDDVAGNSSITKDTVETCRMILTHTQWHIRLLSKSALLRRVAEELAEYRERMIFGLSTGTFDDRLAAAYEKGASSPTARLRSLHWLQDNGFRTFGMICPSLPQDDYERFAANAATALRVDRCEHIWAEVLNLRGRSLMQTVSALDAAGFNGEAKRVLAVSGKNNAAAWEEYARNTFKAHTKVIPPGKLRFLQYVTQDSVGWWQKQESLGAIPLGKHALTLV